jgi:hypothetical protein
MIVYWVVLYVTGQMFNKGLAFGSYAIYLIGIIMACINFSKVNEGNVTYGNVFGAGFRTTALVSIIYFVWMLLAFKLIFPDLKDKMLEYTMQEMIRKNTPQDIIDKSMPFMTKYMTMIIIGSTLFYGVLAGVIFSLIGAAVAKKNPKPVV